MAIIDNDLQLRTDWGTHTQADGSNIGGTPPLGYGSFLATLNGQTVRVFYNLGAAAKYSDVESYLIRPVLPNTGNLRLDAEITVVGAPGSIQALELDTILVVNGLKYNFSHQLNYAEGGRLQIADAAGGWVDIGAAPGPLPQGVPHLFTVLYAFTGSTYSVLSIGIDGTVYAVPANLQNLAGVPCNWKSGAYLQVQQDVASAGGLWLLLLGETSYTWS